MKPVPVKPQGGIFRGRRGDPSAAPRCGAITRRGTPCQRAKERNPHTGNLKNADLHGGLSSGPKRQKDKPESPLRIGGMVNNQIGQRGAPRSSGKARGPKGQDERETMTVRCSICKLPERKRAAVDAALAAGDVSLVEVSVSSGFPKARFRGTVNICNCQKPNAESLPFARHDGSR